MAISSHSLQVEVKSRSEDSASDLTSYHLGLPNFKIFLCLRYLLAVWAIFLGAFYEESCGWSAGTLLLLVALSYTVARIVPSWWKYRLVMASVDMGTILVAILGLVLGTLIKAVYGFVVCFLAAQLAVNLLAYPLEAVQPFCFPSINPIVVPLDAKKQSNDGWKLKKLPFLLAWLVVVMVFSLMVMHSGQRFFIYPGTLFKVHIPETIRTDIHLRAELVSFKTNDNMRISAFFLTPTKNAATRIALNHPTLPRLTMWIFYGNTGNMVHQLDYIVPFLQKAYPNFQFFIFSYRGYVNSDGRPHIKGLRQDIDAAVSYLKSREDVNLERLVAYGHSIGGALVSDILGRHPGLIKATLFSNTFLSMHKMSEVWHLTWLKPFITEVWDSEAAFKKAVSNGSLPPILFMTSRKDELIPASHMDEFHRIAMTKPGAKKSDYVKVSYEEGTHNVWGEDDKCVETWSKFFRGLYEELPVAVRRKSSRSKPYFKIKKRKDI